MNNQRPALASSFNKIADDYDKYRSGYDPAVTDEIIKRCTGKVACEVGAGTGLGTVPFAEEQFEITCIEPGDALLVKARERLGRFPKIRYINQKFEDADLSANYFDLVFSAQAFGWVDEKISYKKAAQILKPGGVFAFYYKRGIPDDTPRSREEWQLIKEYLPNIPDWTITEYERSILRDLTLMVETDCFERCSLLRFPAPSVPKPSPEAQAKSFGTWSEIAALPEDKRLEAIERMRLIIEKYANNENEQRHETTVVIGFKRG